MNGLPALDAKITSKAVACKANMMKVTPGWRNPSKIPGRDPPSVADFGVDFCANFYHLASARRRILRCPSQIRVEDLLATMLDSGSF